MDSNQVRTNQKARMLSQSEGSYAKPIRGLKLKLELQCNESDSLNLVSYYFYMFNYFLFGNKHLN